MYIYVIIYIYIYIMLLNILCIIYIIILYMCTWGRLVYNMVFRLLLTKFLLTKEKLKFF